MTRIVVQRGGGGGGLSNNQSQSRPSSSSAPASTSTTPPQASLSSPTTLSLSSSSLATTGDEVAEHAAIIIDAKNSFEEELQTLVGDSSSVRPVSGSLFSEERRGGEDDNTEGSCCCLPLPSSRTPEACGKDDAEDAQSLLLSQLQHVYLFERLSSDVVSETCEVDVSEDVSQRVVGVALEGGEGQVEVLAAEDVIRKDSSPSDEFWRPGSSDSGGRKVGGRNGPSLPSQGHQTPSSSQITASTIPSTAATPLSVPLPIPATCHTLPPVLPIFSAHALPITAPVDPVFFGPKTQQEENELSARLEPLGCSSYISAGLVPPAPPPPCCPPTSSFRRGGNGGWVGSSASNALRGGPTYRRIPRAVKGMRNSPNNSIPTSPRSHGEGDGYNSADEQNSWTPGPSGYEDGVERERQFELELLRVKGLEVRHMSEDGNCLFRAVADRVYGDAEMYDETRQMCIDYMEKERDHFSQFVTESFTAYCKRKRRDKVYGNNLEIQAMAEMYNRPIHIYSYSTEPINIFHGSYETDLPPIRLSYHRGNHYNSLVDPRNPAVGAGLGFGSLRGRNVDTEQVKAALNAQQEQQIDKALLAEGRFYSDMELTEQEIERMVMEASRAEFLAGENRRIHIPWHEETSTSAGAEPSSSNTTGSSRNTGNLLDPVQALSNLSVSCPVTSAPSEGRAPSNNVRMLLSMGFSYLRVMEAHSIFGDNINNMLCYLLETDAHNCADGENHVSRRKGKAAE